MKDPATEKRRLRRQALRRRAAMAPEQAAAAARRVEAHLEGLTAWTAARTVHLYVSSMANELDTHRLLSAACARGCRVLVPHVAGPGAPMHHAEISGMADLSPGPWGLLQPATPRFVDDLDDLDIVLVPGVLFDRCGYRIGHGGGYYDRFLGAVPQVVSLGLTYDEFFVDRVPTEAHDVPLHGVVTPAAVHTPRERSPRHDS